MVGMATAEARPNLHYALVDPATKVDYGCPPMGWRFDRARMASLIEEGRILWPSAPGGRPRQKVFLNEFKSQFTGFSSVIGEGIFTRDGTRDLDALMPGRPFPFPKPKELIKSLIKQGTPEGGLVLDSFAGSGTTGQAVAELAAAGGEGLRFILVEIDAQIATNVTAKRLGGAMSRLRSDGAAGAGFRYCNLGRPLFDEWGSVNEGVTFSDLAAFVFFSDTGSPIPARATGETSLLGTFQNRVIHLLFAVASAGVASPSAGNVLTLSVLESLPPFEGPRVVYAEGCTVPPERLAAAGVVFKQVPYQLQAT